MKHESFRLEMGAAFTSKKQKLHPSALIGISYPFGDYVMGLWYGPFWRAEDPRGIFIGRKF